MSKIFGMIPNNPPNKSSLSSSPLYRLFRGSIPQRKIAVDDDSSKTWTLFDSGPQSITCPLICLPPTSGTADIFFMQIMQLVKYGYRVIALHYPIYWTIREFVEGFTKLLDHLKLDKVHIFGATLGGFLAQKYAELSVNCPRVESLILCNSFADTATFQHIETAGLFWMLPMIVLRKLAMSYGLLVNLSSDPNIQNSIDFMIEKLESLSRPELASRLTLNCYTNYVIPQKIQDVSITIMDVFDNCAINQKVREDLYKSYPNAKRAHLKTGGNFPYLSKHEEVNMHLIVHLRQFDNTKYSARGQVENFTPTTSCNPNNNCSQVDLGIEPMS